MGADRGQCCENSISNDWSARKHVLSKLPKALDLIVVNYKAARVGTRFA
jgi:hypothetical protein